MRRERGDAHRDQGSLGGRERPDGRQELIGPGTINGPEQGSTTLGQDQQPLPPILGLLTTLGESTPDEAIDQAARRRRGTAERLREVADRGHGTFGQHVQRRELGEAETKVTEL